MSKKTASLSLCSNAHNEKLNSMLRQTFRLSRFVTQFVLLFSCSDLLAQLRASCDSLESAWAFYAEAEFEEAKILVGNCEELSALELRTCLALKERRLSLADTLLCKLLTRDKDYKFDPKRQQPPELIARSKELKKNFRKVCEPKLFGLRHPPLLIERDTNILHWLEVNVGIGSNFGTDAKNPILLHARSNLVYFAELEFRTIEIANNLPNRRTELPTLAIRAHFPLNRMHSELPAMGAILRSSIELRDWDSDEINNVKFRKGLKEVRLFVSSFEYWRTFEFHVGVNISSLRTCPHEISVRPDDTLCKERRNVNVFAAYQWRYKEAVLMITWETVPEYKFDLFGPSLPTMQDVLTINIRALPVPGLALDLGGIWYTELDENNFNLKLNGIVGFSLANIFSKLHWCEVHP